MAARRRIDPAAGAQALRQWAQEQDTPGDGAANAPEGPASAERVAGGAATASPANRAARRRVTATAVRHTLEELAARASRRSVEVRVPPFGVTQAIAGIAHHRGTLPSVVETDVATWLVLATGRLAQQDALVDDALHASDERCDLPACLPLVRLPG